MDLLVFVHIMPLVSTRLVTIVLLLAWLSLLLPLGLLRNKQLSVGIMTKLHVVQHISHTLRTMALDFHVSNLALTVRS